MASYSIDVKGIKNYSNKLDKHNLKLKKYLKGSLKVSAKKLITTVRQMIVSKGMQDRGGYSQSLARRFLTDYAIEVGSNLPYPPVLEGKKRITWFPPPQALSKWAERKLGVDKKRARALGFVLARALKRRGRIKHPYPVVAVSVGKVTPFFHRLVIQAIEKSNIDLTR